MNVSSWTLTKFALIAVLLWALLMVFSAFGIDLLLHGTVSVDDLGMGLFWSGVVACAIGLLINPVSWLTGHLVSDPYAELVITTPRWTVCGMVTGLALMAASCAYALASRPADRTEYGLALAGLLIFGAALLGLLIVRRANTLKVSPKGLDYSGFGCGPIGWPDIAAVEADYVWRSPVVTLQLRDEEKYIQRGTRSIGPRRRWLRFFMGSPFSIPTAMFNVSPGWLRHAIQLRLDQFGVSTPIHPTVQRQGTAA